MKPRVVITAICILVIAVIAGIAMYPRNRHSGGAPAATSVSVKNPTVGDLTESINVLGEIEPLTKVSISAKVAARIVELPFQEGQQVTKGDLQANPPSPASVLVRLDATDLQAALRSTEARHAAQAAQIEVEANNVASRRSDLAAMVASLQQAKLDLERSTQLCQSGIASQSELDQARNHYDEFEAKRASAAESLKAAEANLQVSQHNLEAAEAEVAQAREAVSYTTIQAPIGGVVTRVNGKVGELVVTGTMNTPGTVIMEVADLSQMRVVVRLEESDIGVIASGQNAVVRIHAYPDEVFKGTVESVALTPDFTPEGAKYFKARILLDHAQRAINAGLGADADIITRKNTNVIKIPSDAILARSADAIPAEILKSAVRSDQTRSRIAVVFRLVDGRAVITPITVGGSDANDTVVDAGLVKNDMVITGPYKTLDALRHGEPVSVADASK